MIILKRCYSNAGIASKQIIALFGAGLVGRSIVAYASNVLGFEQRQFSFDWKHSSQRAHDALAIERYILNEGREFNAALIRIDVIWSAGKAGFNSQLVDLEPELAAYTDVLKLSARLYSQLPEVRHAFHLLSSAGGIFEGQRNVDQMSVPHPRRAYGVAKIRQEVHLSQHLPFVTRQIYRPSSIYGFAGTGVRLGLVNALVHNAHQARVSRIFGEPSTIRDYVFVSDIGRFVAERCVTPLGESSVFFLASGKPSSMFEMLSKIEHALGRRLYLQFDPNPSNASHISFAQSVLPVGWLPTDLNVGIRQTARQLMSSFAQPART
ncbi:NAD-dependent epimerase/dehydratase family protein [Microvirga sp. Mcv34]|uniref:NAD-dependent epimerase/dehydratase family protein n=1 Tax=Microvirga sp. Mcv34 TaxID=2926016 RepID=UPI0021C7DE82|nr:NAD-dependent epimerase/dehydratase family protein [Microvirga sp. Mcv34]